MTLRSHAMASSASTTTEQSVWGDDTNELPFLNDFLLEYPDEYAEEEANYESNYVSQVTTTTAESPLSTWDRMDDVKDASNWR